MVVECGSKDVKDIIPNDESAEIVGRRRKTCTSRLNTPRSKTHEQTVTEADFRCNP